MLATRLVRDEPGMRLALIDTNRTPGTGVAYATERLEHLLNVPASGMSAYPEDPDHFVRWLGTNRGEITDLWPDYPRRTDFLPRAVYGRYLSHQLRQASENGAIVNVCQRAVDVEPDTHGFSVLLENGRRVRAATCVLATGNEPAADPVCIGSKAFVSSRRYLRDPWDSALIERSHGARSIVLLGSGLTAIDVALTLRTENPDVLLTMISRHGRLPQSHSVDNEILDSPFVLQASNVFSAPSLAALVATVRTEVERAVAAQRDWRTVIDSIRPHSHALWAELSMADRSRFLRHVRNLWEIHRHRAAPSVRAAIGDMIAAKSLRVMAGRLRAIRQNRSEAALTVSTAGSAKQWLLRADLVVNCMGPLTDYRRSKDPLWLHLLRRGLVTADVLGMGINVDAAARTIGASGDPIKRLYALGGLRRPSTYETTAVPELRCQVKRLAESLIGSEVAQGLAV